MTELDKLKIRCFDTEERCRQLLTQLETSNNMISSVAEVLGMDTTNGINQGEVIGRIQALTQQAKELANMRREQGILPKDTNARD